MTTQSTTIHATHQTSIPSSSKSEQTDITHTTLQTTGISLSSIYNNSMDLTSIAPATTGTKQSSILSSSDQTSSSHSTSLTSNNDINVMTTISKVTEDDLSPIAHSSNTASIFHQQSTLLSAVSDLNTAFISTSATTSNTISENDSTFTVDQSTYNKVSSNKEITSPEIDTTSITMTITPTVLSSTQYTSTSTERLLPLSSKYTD